VSEEEKFDKCHFIYISKKLPDADEVSDRYYDECIQLLIPANQEETKPNLKEENKLEEASGTEEQKSARDST